LLSRAICAIAADPYLRDELVFRRGMALHKLHLPQPLRYSEDLDYVRTSQFGIKELTGTLTKLGEELGFEVRTRVTEHPKVVWRATAQTGIPLRLRIEVNTHERSPSLPHLNHPYAVRSAWWSGQTQVRTFQPVELAATKIRALYQRSKGRDPFDLRLALDELALDPEAILAARALGGDAPGCQDGLDRPRGRPGQAPVVHQTAARALQVPARPAARCHRLGHRADGSDATSLRRGTRTGAA
jgi:hypothetical protein